MSVLCRWLCSTDGRGSLVVVWCAPAILWVWVCGFEFMGMGLWVWVHGSMFCGASTSRLAATIVGSSCIWKETRKLCQGTSQSTFKSWTKEALLRRNGIASLARLTIANVHDDSKTIHRDSWHRFRVVGFVWGLDRGGGFWLGLRTRWVGGDWGELLWLRRGSWIWWVLLAVAAVSLGFVGFVCHSILCLPFFLSRWGFSLSSLV